MHRSDSGTSLIELLIAVAVLLIVLAAAVSIFSNSIKVNKAELSVVDVDQQVKSALMLITTEIEQAGSNPDPRQDASYQLPRLTSPPITLSSSTSKLLVTRTEALNVGNKITLQNGTTTQEVSIVSVTRTSNDPALAGEIVVTPQANTFPTGTYIRVKNLPFDEGILYAPPAGRPAWSSNATTLRIFGDLNENGAFYYTEYRFVQESPTRGYIVRASEMVSGAALPPTSSTTFKQGYTILDNIVPNPANTPIFQYVADDMGNIVSVVITVTVQPLTDNQKQAPRITYRLTSTSRNVLNASSMQRDMESNALDLPVVPTYIKELAKWPL